MSPRRKQSRIVYAVLVPRRHQLHITQSASKFWGISVNGRFSNWYKTQAVAVARACTLARKLGKGGGLVSLRLHGRTGRILWERTYPRSSDPRRFKG